MLRLGLTGGIGSGKSTVAQMLVVHGGVLIDADAISRATTASGGAAMAQIAEQFGKQAINADGAMNRDMMRQLVFADPAAKLQLEAIIHPLVSREVARQTAAAQSAGNALAVFDIPLLVESKRWRHQLDKVLVVDCEEATQISRVMARQGTNQSWTREALEKVIAQQATRSQRRAAADWVIYNEGEIGILGLDALAAQVKQLVKSVKL
jgi:dephospho-CoA kinase